jgi:transcriptional regulator with XRE-family HTH domain
MKKEAAINFGLRLRELREAANQSREGLHDSAGWTQAELAQRAGIHKQAIVKLERGEREPAWSTLLALCDALGCDLNAFAVKPSRKIKPRGRGRPKKT